MIENESISKKERMDNSGPDLLSDLPLGIIHIILALIPIRDAVRTSVLSRQWRYTWATLPSLVFDRKCANLEGKSQSEFEECMRSIISHVLSCHKGPIHKFEMAFSFECSSPDIHEWILHLSRNDVKELILDMGDPHFHESVQVHSSIYSCEKLTCLELGNCELDPPPSTFKGFLFLRCLSLHDINLPPDGIGSLVDNSPLLERIKLTESGEPELRIRARNLKYLYLNGEYKEICLYAPLLAEISVLTIYHFTAGHSHHKSSVCNYTNFMGGFTNLETLSGELYFTKFLSIGIESCHHTLVFNHLTKIELDDVNFEDIKEITVLARLIIGSPNLDVLKISTNYDLRVDDHPSDSEAPEVSFRDFGCAPNFTFEKLRVVIMRFVSGFRPEMEFLKFLLESSPVLDRMYIDLIRALGTEEKQNLKNDLQGWNWASPDLEVMIRVP